MSRPSCPKQLLRPLLAAVIASMSVVAFGSPVRAECPFFVIPPATEAAPTAREVIVGAVVENLRGDYADFRLRIDHVLRGPSKVGEIRRFNYLWPGWPLAETEGGTRYGPCEPIRASEGDVIALSLDALAPDGTTRYNAESWLSGGLPYNFDEPRTTLAEMEAITERNAPQTDTASASVADSPPSGSSPAPLVGLTGAACVLALVAIRRRWRQTNR